MKTTAARFGAHLLLLTLASPVAAHDIYFSSAYPDWEVQVDGGPIESNPTILLIRGESYNIHVSGLFGGFHTFYINTANSTGSANAYNGSFLSDNGISNDTPSNSPIVFNVPQDAPDVLWYNCGNHSSMAGMITVDGVFRNGFEP